MTNIKAPRFNPSSPDFQENLYTIYQNMRKKAVTRIGKTWVLTRYTDVYRAFKDNSLVSLGIPDDLHGELEKLDFNVSPSLRDLIYGIILFEDGHNHHQHRRALQTVFTVSFFLKMVIIIISTAELFRPYFRVSPGML